MSVVKILELVPNRDLIDTEFSGYKLSLDAIPIEDKALNVSVDRVFPHSNRYSFLHARLFGLHNHLIGETIDGIEFVYFVDTSWSIHKVSVDEFSQIQDVEVLRIAMETEPSEYNVSLKLLTETTALFCNGAGKIFVVETGHRKQNNHWECLSTIEALDKNQSFIVQDARYYKSVDGDRIHCLLYRIKQTEDEHKYCNILHWVVLNKQDDNNWTKAECRELFGSSGSTIYYAYLESSCGALYIISNGEVHFRTDLDVTTVSRNISNNRYQWTQTIENVLIKIKLPDNLNPDCLHINVETTEIRVFVNERRIFGGQLSHGIKEDLTSRSVENGFLEIKLAKEDDQLWTAVIPGDKSGEYIADMVLDLQAHELLINLSAEDEVLTSSGITFNMQQIEECDFEGNKITNFQRLSWLTSLTTHRANVNDHTLVLTVEINPDLAPAIAFRHDVDAYIWQPIIEKGEFFLKHEGSLNALGYVQASKQERKYTVCAPNLSYCVICEALRHAFIYRQESAIKGGELRQRSTGKTVRHIAEQHVISLRGDEILGIYAAETKLILLGLKHMYVLSL